MNRMIIKLLSIFFLFGISHSAYALDIIYPQKAQYNTWAKETYILGNIQQGSKLKINNQNVKIWKNNIFCHIVPLKDGQNTVVVEEIQNQTKSTKVFKINRPVSAQKSAPKAVAKTKITKHNNLIYGTIVTDGAPVREKPSQAGNRVTHLAADTVVLIDAETDNWYKIYVGDEKQPLWIFKKNVQKMYPVNNRYLSNINDVDFDNDRNFEKMKIVFDFPLPYKITEKGGDIEITIWGIKDVSKLEKEIKRQKVFQNAQITSYENNNVSILIPSEKQLWGYDAEYDKNVLTFKKRKAPKIHSNPLHGIVICIDPGHGGKEKGTVGPSRIPEKDVNLAISLKLKKELERNGAKVIMTRETDKDVDIYQRPEIANKNKALLSLSIHANSMVDGNPYVKHGIETYYYNPHAKKLADTIKKQMVSELCLKDNGTNYVSFVLTRPTMPVSVLIEVAYMPNPEEYLKLTDSIFQQKAAHSICEGVKQYLIMNAE